ncbi:Hypothetical Protein FCC1311_029402 [Hondaea fermentalgiana]|uniref:Uncharacterized protein n=1 Tax=Hondaea fermentalgiana TaxID=2315210 RepID=A0A2R5G8Q9_9STRA|nr:Hypothetical Protein FCC1311_029402 [Hondaea fermentalgiana]|eukprot:GBG26719.1 Hypothetical Protein FCC1311_029402 [Hondaea fermentalgiana]
MATFTIVGYEGCGYLNHAELEAERLTKMHPEVKAEVTSMARDEYLAWLKKTFAKTKIEHKTSPAIWKGSPEEGVFIGGASDFDQFVTSEYKDMQPAAAEGGCCIIS